MKPFTLLALLAAVLGFSSCENLENLNPFDKEKQEKVCPTVSSELVPQAVLEGFAAKYPQITATTWFNKDETGYCALFDENGSQTLALFDKDGTFKQSELADQEQEGNHKDKDNGCECTTGEQD